MKHLRLLLLFWMSTLCWAAPPEKATFAGGCFWCEQAAFDELKGVISTTAGYSGGTVRNPTYEQVSAGGTGHVESVQVLYDPAVVSYRELLVHFWKNVDPTVPNRQFCDLGAQYRSVIFAHNPEQMKQAWLSLNLVQGIFKHVYTQVVEFRNFYPAEEYHQSYYKKNPIRYKFYKWNCGRAQRLESLWTPERLKKLDSFKNR